jgi:hypothetical protein
MKMRIPYFVARGLQCVVALVLLLAALLKAMDPPSFITQIAEYGVFPHLAPVAAWVFLLVEFALAFGLLLNLFPRLWNIGAILLMLVFIGATLYAMNTGTLENCGCFGALIHRPPEQVLIEDGLMAAALIYPLVLFWNHQGSALKLRMTLTGVLTVAAMGMALCSGSLPVDSLVTELKPGMQVPSFLSQNLGFDLAEGKRMVFLVETTKPDFPDLARRISDISQNMPDGCTPVVLITDPSEQLMKLSFQYGITCPAAWVDQRAARTLYRKLPRSFLVSNGKVIKIWEGIAPLPEIVSAVRENPNR